MKRAINILEKSGDALAVFGLGSYKVVKFMVKVRLMENKVKSHVGSVMVVKVMML
jgi:hypothetical protein